MRDLLFLLIYSTTSQSTRVNTGRLELPDKYVEYELHQLDTSEVEHSDKTAVIDWFKNTEKEVCTTQMSFPQPTSYLEMESYADLLMKNNMLDAACTDPKCVIPLAVKRMIDSDGSLRNEIVDIVRKRTSK